MDNSQPRMTREEFLACLRRRETFIMYAYHVSAFVLKSDDFLSQPLPSFEEAVGFPASDIVEFEQIWMGREGRDDPRETYARLKDGRLVYQKDVSIALPQDCLDEM